MNNSFFGPLYGYSNNPFDQGLGALGGYNSYAFAQQAYNAQQAYAAAAAQQAHRPQAATNTVDLVKHNGVWMLPEDVMTKEIGKGT